MAPSSKMSVRAFQKRIRVREVLLLSGSVWVWMGPTGMVSEGWGV